LPAAADPPATTEEAPTKPVVEKAADSPAPAAAAAPTPAAGADDPNKYPTTWKKRRGGINPCMTPDPGFGVYDPWGGGLSVGQVLIPHKGGVSKTGAFD